MSEHDFFQWRNGRLTKTPLDFRIATSFLEIVGFTISLGLVFMGYSYGKSLSVRSNATLQVVPNYDFSFEKMTPSATPEVPTDTPSPAVESPPGEADVENEASSVSRCADGYIERISSYSFCLPEEFVGDTEYGVLGKQYEADDQQFIVYTNSSFKFPIHICTSEQSVMVAGRAATRSVFREDTGIGCGEITGFASRIDAGENTYLIRLFRTSGTYENQDMYQVIEQSFVF